MHGQSPRSGESTLALLLARGAVPVWGKQASNRRHVCCERRTAKAGMPISQISPLAGRPGLSVSGSAPAWGLTAGCRHVRARSGALDTVRPGGELKVRLVLRDVYKDGRWSRSLLSHLPLHLFSYFLSHRRYVCIPSASIPASILTFDAYNQGCGPHRIE